MKKDVVDDILEQWSEERPELETESLGVVIRVTSLSRAFLRQATEALAPMELELFEYDVLSALRRQGRPYELPATGLAKETGLSSGAMTNRIDKLESRGFVTRKADKSDRRAVIVSLTSEGKQAIDDAIQLRLDAADESLKGLSGRELSDLAKLLRKVRLTGVPEAEDAGI
jgi:DNA-binding MarR family transcriptional regulator